MKQRPATTKEHIEHVHGKGVTCYCCGLSTLGQSYVAEADGHVRHCYCRAEDIQPALPGAEHVRELENQTPAFDAPFTLSGGILYRDGRQANLFPAKG